MDRGDDFTYLSRVLADLPAALVDVCARTALKAAEASRLDEQAPGEASRRRQDGQTPDSAGRRRMPLARVLRGGLTDRHAVRAAEFGQQVLKVADFFDVVNDPGLRHPVGEPADEQPVHWGQQW